MSEKPPGRPDEQPPSPASMGLGTALGARPRRTQRVAVLSCDPSSPLESRGDESFEYEHAQAADLAFVAALEEAGFEVSWRPVHLGNVDAVVDALDCDVVFNLCDGSGPGLDNNPGVEALVALERRGLPYTGSRIEPYRTSISKVSMKERFVAAGVPTAPWQLLSSPDEPLRDDLANRALFVKPHDAGGSAGVHLSSIIDAGDEVALRARVAEIFADYGAALVEEYIDGREVTVGLLGIGERAKALPPLEVRFGSAFPPGKGIRTHATKWDTSSPLYGGFDLLCPAPLTLAATRRVLRVAREAYSAIGGAGYGRVDMRLDARGPWVLEVNMNCSLEYGESVSDCAMYPYAAQAAGISFPRLLTRMIEDARRFHRAQRASTRATGRTRSIRVGSLEAERQGRRRS